MNQGVPGRSIFRFFVALTAVLLAVYAVWLRVLEPLAADAGYTFTNVRVDESLVDWLSLAIWPTYAVICVALWLVPQLKERFTETWVGARVSLWLLAVGWGCEVAGRVVAHAGL